MHGLKYPWDAARNVKKVLEEPQGEWDIAQIRSMADRSDPVSVVLRQDEAFGPDGIDLDLWNSSLSFPVVMFNSDEQVMIPDVETATDYILRIEKIARAAGVMALRTQILTNVQLTPESTILASIREHLDKDGKVISSTSMTWTVSRTHQGWRITQLFFDGAKYDLMDKRGTLNLKDEDT